jgi:hypothetical protein
MSKIASSSRARGGNRGGIGGGYEATNPEYNSDKLRRLRADYDAMAPEWRQTFLDGLSPWERKFVTDRRMETPQD